MSSASSLAAAAAASSSTSPPTPLFETTSQLHSALTKATPYIRTAFTFALDVIKSTLAFSQRFMINPVPVILYIIAPLTVFIGYLVTVLILTPYTTVVYLLEALHPLYVFCGVACLTGAFLGVVGRFVAWGLVALITPNSAPRTTKGERKGIVKDELLQEADGYL